MEQSAKQAWLFTAMTLLGVAIFGYATGALMWTPLLAPACGIAGSIKGMTHDRRLGALMVYVLVIVNAVAFVSKPLKEIPACF